MTKTPFYAPYFQHALEPGELQFVSLATAVRCWARVPLVTEAGLGNHGRVTDAQVHSTRIGHLEVLWRSPDMANTMLLRRQVEDFVRSELKARYGQAFSPHFLQLRTGGIHEFDAVSEDGSIVASVKAASGKTAGGNNPSGKIKDCLAELYYLSLLEAPSRILILTTPAFHQIFTKVTTGALVEGVSLECMPLPAELQLLVEKVVHQASQEVTPAIVGELAAEQVERETGL